MLQNVDCFKENPEMDPPVIWSWGLVCNMGGVIVVERLLVAARCNLHLLFPIPCVYIYIYVRVPQGPTKGQAKDSMNNHAMVKSMNNHAMVNQLKRIQSIHDKS